MWKREEMKCVSERLISEREAKLKEYGVVVSSVVSYILEDGPSNCDSPQDESKVKINTTDDTRNISIILPVEHNLRSNKNTKDKILAL